jgi:hypothetical protein
MRAVILVLAVAVLRVLRAALRDLSGSGLLLRAPPKPRNRDRGDSLECTPKVRQAIKGPATLNGGEQCWCPDKSIPVN